MHEIITEFLTEDGVGGILSDPFDVDHLVEFSHKFNKIARMRSFVGF